MIWYVNTHLFKTNFTSILRLHREIRMYVITVQQSLFNVLYAGLRIRIRWHQAIFSRVGSGLASTPPRSAILHWSIPIIYLLYWLLYWTKNFKGESILGRIRVFFLWLDSEPVFLEGRIRLRFNSTRIHNPCFQ